ncbi:unnamed protein product [Microthlaspi erraticum]|uniref:Zinc finger PHD-type domain-containing protein n=1 Tax=Microthlaspi erraticum TaxID=1685480 RepID=A0A6D2I8K8_9BRAS|nr:unnamed protein product [Microthlaspi erraticum]
MDLLKQQPTHKHRLSLVVGQSECKACSLHTEADHFYHCSTCNVSFHKECTEYSLIIPTHPYHPRHPLKIRTRKSEDVVEDCLWCKRNMGYIFYHCSVCNLNIHLFCASQAHLVFTLDPGEKHDHPLTIFPRRMDFTCNLCGFYGDWFPIYACIKCDFMVHKDCLDLPSIIRISCHEHRLSRRLSLPLEEWSCGICHTLVDSMYGAFSCSTKDCSYVVHTRCATLDVVWDKRELEGIPEAVDELKDVYPYEVIDGNIIKHFSHEHYLRLVPNEDSNGFIDRTRCCQACCFPIQCDNFYNCDHYKDCSFSLHEKCANLPRRRWSTLHPHPLSLKADDITFSYSTRRGFYFCSTCTRFSCGFRYVCEEDTCRFVADVRCASIPESLNHKSHPHPMFISLRNRGEMTCVTCGKASSIALYCLQCPFFMCFKCSTIPDKFLYMYDGDEYALTLCCGEEEEEDVKGQYWCFICEKKVDPKKWFYVGDHSGGTLHTTCVLGSSSYAKPGRAMINHGSDEKEFEIISNNEDSRPLCCMCDRHCPDSVAFKQEDNIYCSSDCLSIQNLD